MRKCDKDGRDCCVCGVGDCILTKLPATMPEGPALNVRRDTAVTCVTGTICCASACVDAGRCMVTAAELAPGIPSDRATRKATPIYSGFIKYFPDAMAAVAQLSHSANEVHNPGEPLHWSKGKSNDHPDCMARHLTEIDEYDREPDHDYHYLHAVKNAWRAMAHLQTLMDKGKAPRVKKGELP